MKRLFVLMLLLSAVLPVDAQFDRVDCTPGNVAEWMVQRQVGRNQINILIQPDGAGIELMDALLEVQAIRRELDALPRPECADDLYMLTVYFYNAIADGIVLGLADDMAGGTALVEEHGGIYNSLVNDYYEPLQAIAGVDVMAEASDIVPVPPTPIPRDVLEMSGDTGGVVYGPADFPTGLYRMTLAGELGVSATIQAVSGTCYGTYIYIGEQGQTEEVFESQNCRALVEISQSSNPWSLTWEPVQ